MFLLGAPGLSTTSSCSAVYFKDLLLVLSSVVTQIQFGYVSALHGAHMRVIYWRLHVLRSHTVARRLFLQGTTNNPLLMRFVRQE